MVHAKGTDDPSSSLFTQRQQAQAQHHVMHSLELCVETFSGGGATFVRNSLVEHREYGLQEILCTGQFAKIQNGMNMMQSMGQLTQ